MTNALKISKLKNFDSVMAFVAFSGATTLAVGCFHLAYEFGWFVSESFFFLVVMFFWPVWIVILPLNFALTIVAIYFHPLSWRIWLPALLYVAAGTVTILEIQDLIAGSAWILHGTVSLAISIEWSKYSVRGSV